MSTLRRLFSSLLLISLLTTAAATQTSAATNAIVTLKPGASLELTLTLLNGMLLDEIPDSRTYLVSVPSLPLTLPDTVQYIEANETVSLPGALQVGVLVPSDDTVAHWYAAQPALQVVRATDALAYSTGLGVVVADIDARFDTSHPALTGRLTGGRDFVATRQDESDGDLDQSSASYMFEDYEPLLDQSSASYMFESSMGFVDQSSASYMFEQAGVDFPADSVVRLLDSSGAGYSHGTFTAGLIAVTAPEAQIMPIRAFDDQGQADIFTLAKSIRYATSNGAHVINMSWGTAADTKTLHNAIEFAHNKGVVLIASAGNLDTESRYYPAAYAEVMSVVATDEVDRKATFSNFGDHVYTDAPGVNIISAYPGGYYSVKSGTSFSAPMVSGLAALLQSMQFGDVQSRIGGTAVNVDSRNPNHAGKLGAGRIDMHEAVARP